MTNDRADTKTFLHVVDALLAGGHRVRFQARGRSMLPAIEDGEIVHVARVEWRKLKVGDIVLFSNAKEFKAHRIIRKCGSLFITRGDAGMDMDAALGADQILGKVVSKECRRSGRKIPLDNSRARAQFFWNELRRNFAALTSISSRAKQYTSAILFVLLASISLRGAVTADHSASGAQLLGGTGSITLSPISLNVTATGTNRLLIVGISLNTSGNGKSSVTGITWSGSQGTQTFNSANSFLANPGNNLRVEVWYLVAPNTGVNNINVTIDKSGGSGSKLGVVVGAADFTGADQTSPIRASTTASGTSTTPSVTVASATPEIVLDTVATSAAVTATIPAGQTQRWSTASAGTPAGQNAHGIGSTKPGASTVTMTETLSASTAWTDMAISIRPPGADLAIAKSASPNPVLQNGALTYTLTVTNNGPLTATSVVVVDTLPTQVSFVSATSAGASCVQAAGVVTCTVASMSSGQTVTITIVTTAVTRPQATNTASVTSLTSDPDLSNNSAPVTTLIESPSAVNISSFSASQTPRGTLLSWKTGAEVHNLGFNVYREISGEKVRLNASLIAGSALLTREPLSQHSAKTYGSIDFSPIPGALYWLEDVDLNGTRTMHGPVSLETGPSTDISPVLRSATIAEMSANHASAPQTALTNLRQRVTLPPMPSTSLVSGFQLAAQPAVRIFVDHEGWYRITQPQLVAAGLNPEAASRSLHLFAEGVEQPIRVIGSGRFGPQSAIEFYGTAIDTPYSGQRVYWLTTQAGTGLRLREIHNAGTPGPEPQSFLQTLELKPRTTYFAALLRDGTDNFFGPLVTTTAESLNFNIANLASGEGKLSLTLQGVTQGQKHDVTVMLNGATLGDVTFMGQDEGSAEFNVPAGVFVNGLNTIALTAQQGANDVSLVDKIDASFPHTFTADSDQLRFTADAGATVQLDGFTQTPTRLIDITDPLNPVELAYDAAAQNGSFGLRTTVPWTAAGEHTLLALADDQLSSPASIVAHQPSHLHDAQPGANMVIITAPQFSSQLQPLATFHQQQGTPTVLVSVDDIYDEFNFGERSPFAIRAFLQTATAAWTNKPRYLLLAGDASVDPRGYLGFGFSDFVPTRIVPTAELKTASDDWFSDFNNTGRATIATGRMPGRTAADMQTMVAKTLGYASGQAAAWNNQALLVADEDDPALSFTQAAQAIQGLFPQTITSTDIFVNDLGISTAHQNLLAAINNGQVLVNYTGHGSVEVWSGNNLFDDAAAASLTNGDKLPLFVIMNCLNGFFHDVFTESLASSLMLAPEGGAVMVWASSGLTPPEPQFQMDQALVSTLFSQPGIALGDAVLAAKTGIADQDVRRTFIFFGDPLLQLKIPQNLTDQTNTPSQTLKKVPETPVMSLPFKGGQSRSPQ